jgi:hypothetical protein
MKSSGEPWDQFAGLETDYDENAYTTAIDKSHPQYKQRLAEAERKAREITSSAPLNSHVAEERITDNLAAEDGIDEEDKYSGVRRQLDFPPLTSSNNKYTPPARRAPTAQPTVSGAPVDPAIISAQLARPDKPAVEKSKAPATKATKPEVATPHSTKETSATAAPEPKVTTTATSAASSSAVRTASPQVKSGGVPNATATVERDVTTAFKTFAASQRRNVDQIRQSRAKNDKEIKLNDLKKFADSFKLNTPVPSDLVSIIAKDPAKQKEIQEKAKRNAEEAQKNPSEAAKSIPAPTEAKPAPRSNIGSHGTSPANVPGRQNNGRNPNFAHQVPFNNSQSFRGPSQSSQPPQTQQNRQPGTLGARLRDREHSKQSQGTPNPIPANDTRLPPTGPANAMDPNFSRRSSGVASAQGARLNPNSSEFRPSPHAATFSPNGNPSTGSSPRSAVNPVSQPSIPRSLLRRQPIPESERPTIRGKFNALEHIKTLKPPPGKTWEKTDGTKPAYDTPPTWRQLADNEPEGSNMHLTYSKLFEMQPYPPQAMSSPNPSHAMPTQVAHQHQLPFHLQQGVHNMASRGSPRQPPMNVHANQHSQGGPPPYSSHDDHRMMPSHSAQSYASPRLQPAPMGYPSPMGQPAQLAYNPQMMPYPGAPPIQGPYRSLSQSYHMPQQAHMGPIMMPNPAGTFLTSQGMAPGPQMIYPQGGQGPFMQPGNGHPPAMPGVNGFPSPGRTAPMMISQGSQQSHQQPMFGINPGMSPGPQFGAPIFAQQPPNQMPMRGYGGPNQFGTSPQQMHQFGPQQHRNNQNGNYNNSKNFQPHGQHPHGPANTQIPTGPQARTSEGNEESK